MIVSRTLYDLTSNLDLVDGIGQRTCTFRFALINGATGEHLGDITPIYNANLTHNTQQMVKRQLTIPLGVVDTATIDVVNNRVAVFMILDGVEYPLGRYVFTGSTKQFFFNGTLSNASLVDEMFIVAQPIESGISAAGLEIDTAIYKALQGLDVLISPIPLSEFESSDSWGSGTNRGQILDALSVSGDYFSPWFGNDTQLHYIRTFDPVSAEPDFNYDIGNQVMQAGIVESNNLLTSPNRILVVSNAPNDASAPVIGIADIPTTAPNSIANRGFVVTQVINLQLTSLTQARAVAQGLAQRATVYETVTLSTPPDPRHDSYDVIRWQGENWLELGWNMSLVEGGAMGHSLRKAYS